LFSKEWNKVIEFVEFIKNRY